MLPGMDSPIKPSRRCFAFSLQTLFVLFTVVGLWLGWELRNVREQRIALEWLQSNERSGVSYSIYNAPVIEYGSFPPSGVSSFHALGVTLDSFSSWPWPLSAARSTDGEHVLRRLLGTEETMTWIRLPKELAAHAARLQRIYPAAVIDVDLAPESD